MPKSRNRRRPMAEINVVPYIDVMLVLLIIFMITTPLLTQGVDVTLPEATAESLSADDQMPIIVSVDSAGRYYLNVAADPESPMDPNEVARQVAAQLQVAQDEKTTRAVLVKGDSGVSYGEVVAIMVLLQQAGVKNVGLITQTPDEQQAS